MALEKMNWAEAVTLASPFNYVLGVANTPEGKPNAIGLCWWTFTSVKPQMLLISVAPERYSHECLKHSGEFSLCFPAKDQAKSAWLCGTKSGRDLDKFAEGGFAAAPGVGIDVPHIEGSSVVFECRIVDEFETGDHTCFVGEIVTCLGDAERKDHLYTRFYSKVVSISSDGDIDYDVDFK